MPHHPHVGLCQGCGGYFLFYPHSGELKVWSPTGAEALPLIEKDRCPTPAPVQAETLTADSIRDAKNQLRGLGHNIEPLDMLPGTTFYRTQCRRCQLVFGYHPAHGELTVNEGAGHVTSQTVCK
jgi:hypothetical protein